MTFGLSDILVPIEAHLLILFAIFLRIGAAMSLMPGFGEQAVPVRVRLLLAIAFSAIVWPMAPIARVPTAANFQPIIFLTEPVTGLALGIIFRLFVMVLQLAGMMAAQATSLSQVFGGGATPDPMPAFGNILVIGGLALAMIAGLHVKLATALAQSYEVVPLGVFPSPGQFSAWGIDAITHAFSMAFSLAAPFVIASVIYNVALGAINRAMPQLMVAFIGAPAITLGGLILLALTGPTILIIWLGAFDARLAAPFGAGL